MKEVKTPKIKQHTERINRKGWKPLWKVHTVGLLREMVECNNGMGIFKHPVNIFGGILHQVAERAIELNDPKLNALMCRLSLYSQSDPYSANYDPDSVHELIQQAYKQSPETALIK